MTVFLRPIPSLAVLFLALLALPVAGQSSSDVAPGELVGERLRVRIADGFDPVVGTVVSHEAGVLRLRDAEGHSHTVYPSGVATIERSVGQRKLTGRGFLIGAGLGAAAGVVGGLIVAEAICEPSSCEGGQIRYAAQTGFAVGLLGGLVGALVGSSRSGDRWVPISVFPGPSRLRVEMGASPAKGFAIQGSLTVGGR